MLDVPGRCLGCVHVMSCHRQGSFFRSGFCFMARSPGDTCSVLYALPWILIEHTMHALLSLEYLTAHAVHIFTVPTTSCRTRLWRLHLFRPRCVADPAPAGRRLLSDNGLYTRL